MMHWSISVCTDQRHKIRQIIEETTRVVAGVLTENPISVYFREFDEAARKIRGYWYVASIRDREPVQDQVNSAIEQALQEADFEIWFPSLNFLLKYEVEKGIIDDLALRFADERNRVLNQAVVR